jgi:hypothetical protein
MVAPLRQLPCVVYQFLTVQRQADDLQPPAIIAD